MLSDRRDFGGRGVVVSSFGSISRQTLNFFEMLRNFEILAFQIRRPQASSKSEHRYFGLGRISDLIHFGISVFWLKSGWASAEIG